ncbi:Aste57867_11568 [Aphanomyces stellatus]|uniref:Aste57867_11568 protein n=1 Tax=Aphanomyces stellatus TaxID=120398 RepID=A0A485KTD0_9STRA|nr:hypothetical protein As57867_011525 [Aphanomyces stellatus]VFT88427.1 Aste57867_11568 [Aphanomyces stellatus]
MSDPAPPSNKWGVVAIASVIFDIDVGQSLEMLYPDAAPLSAEARQSIAYLALPHSNKHEEGDTQFSFRFRRQDPNTAVSASTSFYYGFVLFRQRKDTTRNRGYFQKSLVVITTLPFVGLYDRVLRIVGPLYFQVGNPLLQALFENIGHWPSPVPDSTMVLPVAGTFVTFVVPAVLGYDDAPSLYTQRWSLEQESFEVEHDDVADAVAADDDDDDGDDDGGTDAATTIVRNGKFCVHVGDHPPPLPSFADFLNTHELGMSFESVGLYSSFEGMEVCLWDLWQLAITGESLLIASPNSRVCSQAVLAFTSLLAPVPFHGDFRPYFTLYETDFNIMQKLHESQTLPTTVVGTTNPFFLKSLKHWPNALIFPFVDPVVKPNAGAMAPSKTSFTTMMQSDATTSAASSPSTSSMNEDVGSSTPSAATPAAMPPPTNILKQIKRKVALDTFSETEEPRLLTRTTRLVVPDRAVLRQLVEASSKPPTSDGDGEIKPGDEPPHVSINNALLRKHFKHLTERFLKPFEEYFGIWSNHMLTPTTPYMDITAFMKPFHAKDFLAALFSRPLKLPFALRTTRSKVKMLYARFIASPHFQPWFTYRRNECIKAFDAMLRSLRETISSKDLVVESSGAVMDKAACETLLLQIQKTMALEAAKTDPDDNHMLIMQKHFDDVTKKIDTSEGTTTSI